MFYSRNEIGLLLHWRLLPVYGPLSSACEAEFLEHHQTAHCCGRDVMIPAPGHALLAVLGKRRRSIRTPRPGRWTQLYCRWTEIDWAKWSTLAAVYAPEAFDRLEEMRRLGMDVPKLVRPAPPKPSRIKLPGPPAYRRVYRSVRRRAARFVRQYLR